MQIYINNYTKYKGKVTLFIFFSLTGLISLTSSFHQPSQHLTSQQERLNLSNNVIQIIPGLNDLFV